MFFTRTLRLLWLFARIALALFLLHRKGTGAKAARFKRDIVYRKQAIRFRETAARLGGLPIKVGQFLSTRVDVLPRAATDELAKLQDKVAPVPFAEIKTILRQELGKWEEHFRELNPKPLGSASLAQVHAGMLTDGTPVAVKILRPGIERQVQADLLALKVLIGFLRHFRTLQEQVDLTALYQEFTRTLRDELNLVTEGEHLAEFRKNFAASKEVYIPWHLPDLTTKRILVMEKIDGIKITEIAEMRQQGINPKKIADVLLDSYVQQVVDDGFFHADPHPGNLLVDKEGRLVYLDFGMVGRIKDEQKPVFKKGLSSILHGDSELLTQVLVELGFVLPHADLRSIRQGVDLLLSHLAKSGLHDLSTQEAMRLMDEMSQFFLNQPIQVPTDFTFLGRAVGLLLGLLETLAPDINVLDLMQAAARRKETPSLDRDYEFILSELRDYLATILSLPRSLRSIASTLEQGRIPPEIDTFELSAQLDRLTDQLKRLTRLVLVVGAIALYLLFRIWAG